MVGRGIQITIDCRDPRVLVPFWCALLGYQPEEPPDGATSWLAYWRSLGIPPEELMGLDADTVDSIVDPLGARPRIWFQVVPEGKTVKNRVHLDIDVTNRRSLPLAERRLEVTAAVDSAVAMGARVLRTLEPEGADYYAVVMADPEGNEFCLS